MTLSELRTAKREAILRLAEKRGARNLRVFGSVAGGESDSDSDIDFLVDLDPGRSLRDAIDQVEKYVRDGREGFDGSELVQVWVLHHLEIIGEALPRTLESLPCLPPRPDLGGRHQLPKRARPPVLRQ